MKYNLAGIIFGCVYSNELFLENESDEKCPGIFCACGDDETCGECNCAAVPDYRNKCFQSPPISRLVTECSEKEFKEYVYPNTECHGDPDFEIKIDADKCEVFHKF